MEEIVKKLKEGREIKLAKSILESNGYEIKSGNEYTYHDLMNLGLKRPLKRIQRWYVNNYEVPSGLSKEEKEEWLSDTLETSHLLFTRSGEFIRSLLDDSDWIGEDDGDEIDLSFDPDEETDREFFRRNLSPEDYYEDDDD